MMVTEGGGAASFGVTGTTEAGGGVLASVGAALADAGRSSAARDTATVTPATIATLKANHPAVRMTPSLPQRR